MLIVLLLLTCCGCNNRTDSIEEQRANDKGAVSQDILMQERDNGRIDSSGKWFSSEETSGTIDASGKWIPPKGSYVDPKTGNIINKEGITIGSVIPESSFTPDPRGVG